jgi:hypothetical protein
MTLDRLETKERREPAVVAVSADVSRLSMQLASLAELFQRVPELAQFGVQVFERIPQFLGVHTEIASTGVAPQLRVTFQIADPLGLLVSAARAGDVDAD